EFSLGLDWQEVKKQPDDILNLAENIAKEKKLKFIICIDEFQNISGFEDPLALQKKMRSHWQKHKNTSYCLYGSKRHMLMEVFASPSMPFYKFGDILFLQKIDKEEWISFLKKRFSETGKKIGNDNALLITNFADCHPYYVQQLAQQVWLRTEKECYSEIVITAHESLVMQLSLLFQSLTDELSNTQINFLKAVLSEAKQLSSQKTLQEFSLGTSANVLRIKQALLNKEIIDIQGSMVSFLDPIYKYWLKNYFFKI
ncbi:MAG: ATPase, partial [Bacteroidales bacterium]|nr:ATPase [Bacteroidales bacterium]